MRGPPTLRRAARLLGASAALLGACVESAELWDPAGLEGGAPDMSWVRPEEDLPPIELNECGDVNETCTNLALGPPFRLQGDPDPLPWVSDEGLRRDLDGYLGLAESRPGPERLFVANDADPLLGGTVSKFDSRTVRELARYPSVTCGSNRAGSRRPCDGQSGCCSLDDWDRYQARKNHVMPEPPHQSVQLAANNPSRVVVDFLGYAYVANHAWGGQSSVTRIAPVADLAHCVDRNGNGDIDSSRDVNSNGIIDVDCNGDGLPDDLDGVARKPCQNGMGQEYFGLDDECVLWTTNTFRPKAVARPLALVDNDTTNPYDLAVDVWAGGAANGTFVRIDGQTGRCRDDVQLADDCWKRGTGPHGAVIDAAGIAWVAPLGQGRLCWFDARTPGPMRAGVVRDPDWGAVEGAGVTLDRDDDVWIGGGVARYAPDRSGGLPTVGSGFWTRIRGQGGQGITADARSPGAWFVWSCDGQGSVLQIPAASIPPARADQIVVPGRWPKVHMPCAGVGVDAQHNVWGVDKAGVTRAVVDRLGAITQPNVYGAPYGNNKCPAGDSCADPGADTDSDFTGYGFRNFTAPRGFYAYVVRSRCLEQNPNWGTRWLKAEWEVEVPAGASFSARARDGNTPVPDDSWSPYTPAATAFALDLAQLPGDTNYLELQFGFGTTDVSKSARLKSARLFYECIFEK